MIIVFSHIMKTAGTTLNTHFKELYGKDFHRDQKHDSLSIYETACNYEDLKYYKKIFPELKVLSGHHVRPFVDFQEYEKELRWFTILRNPYKRYISHYLHDYNIESNREVKFDEWAQGYSVSNYMVKFISGGDDLEKAKEILVDKFQLVGLVEDLNRSVKMLKNAFGINALDMRMFKPRNKSKQPERKKKLFKRYKRIIIKNNQLDLQLYNYVKTDIYPKLTKKYNYKAVYKPKPKIIREMNKIMFHLKRHYHFRTAPIELQTIKRLVENW